MVAKESIGVGQGRWKVCHMQARGGRYVYIRAMQEHLLTDFLQPVDTLLVGENVLSPKCTFSLENVLAALLIFG